MLQYIYRIAALLFLVVSSWEVLVAQDDVNLPKVSFNTNYAKTSSLTDEQKKEVINALKLKIQKYAYSADFAGEDGNFSDAKYEMFTNLFSNDALISNYLLKKMPTMEAYNYMPFVWDKVRPKYIDQKYKEAELLEISKDASGNFICSIIIYLDVFSSFDDKKGKLIRTPKPSNLVLRAKVIMVPGDEDGAKFVEMKGKDDCPDCGTKTSFANIGAMYGLGSLAGGSSPDGFNNVKPTTSSVGLYAELNRSMGNKEKWHLWIGLGYQSLNVLTDYTGKYNYTASDRSGLKDTIKTIIYNNGSFDPKVKPDTSIVQINQVNSGEENIKGATLLTGVLGLGYRMNVGLKNKLMIRFGVVPTYLSGVAKGDRTTTYDGLERPNQANFPDLNEPGFPKDAYNINGSINDDVIIAQNNFSISAIIAPSIQIPMGFSWGFDAGAAYSFGLNSLFKHIKSENSFLARGGEGEKNTVIQDFLPSSSHSQLQIRAGVYIKLK